MLYSSKSEQSYICSSLLAKPPLRADGRGLLDYRHIALETQVAPLANGSAKINIGGANFTGVGGSLAGTEILAAVKLEVEEIGMGKGVEGGRIDCTVSCAPSAYPNLTNNALDDLQSDLTTTLHDALSHPSLHPKNLTVIPSRKSWLLHLDLVVLSDNGNIYDALFLAACAALRDTRVPKTRSVEYRERKEGSGVYNQVTEQGRSGLDTRQPQKAVDFELSDYWDEGELLLCDRAWPLCITLNIVSPIHYLDATAYEESATGSRALFMFSKDNNEVVFQGLRLLGPGELIVTDIRPLLRRATTYACDLKAAFDAKLDAELGKRSRSQKNLKGIPLQHI